jgi:hypothetical protein
MNTNRREFMFVAVATVAASAAPAVARAAGAQVLPSSVKPLPLPAVGLTPSDYATAVDVNRTFLLSLSGDRLLHNFMQYAGLPPQGSDLRRMGERHARGSYTGSLFVGAGAHV